MHRWTAQKGKIHVNQVEQWYLSERDREYELFTYRFGYLKLAPIPTKGSETGTNLRNEELETG